MAYEPRDGDGKLFANDKGDNTKRPDMTGSLFLGGVTYRLSAWRKEGRNGNADWLSIRCEPQRERGGVRSTVAEDDAPF